MIHLETSPQITLRELDPDKDVEAVASLYNEIEEYVVFETGGPPTEATITEFFEGRPSSVPISQKLLLAIQTAENRDIGLVEIIRGYPESSDWYIGFFVLAPQYRTAGMGKTALDLVIASAAAEGAKRILLCVLEGNPRGRSFWEREGFVYHRTAPPYNAGTQSHTCYEFVRTI